MNRFAHFQRRIARAAWLAALCAALALPLAGGEPGEALGKGLAAKVALGNITLDQVYEVWGPAWHETTRKVRAGVLSPAEGDAALQAAWTEALETVIREELFYQEAVRKTDTMIRKAADAMYEASAGHAPRGPSPRRDKLEDELRKRFEQQVEQQVEDLVQRQVRASGGLAPLRSAIEQRGLSWTEWRERMRKKAFADTYLHQGLRTRVPRQPRPSEIQQYYHGHPKEFEKPGSLRFRHIYFSSEKRGGEEACRDAAAEVYDKLLAKEITFEKAAETYSDDPVSRARGGMETDRTATEGDRYWLADVLEALATETPGQLGSILVSPVGCHIVLLLEKGPPQKISFRDAQKDIVRKLQAEVWEREVQKLYQSLRKEVRVNVLEPRFPPSLSCARMAEVGPRSPLPDRPGVKSWRPGRTPPPAED